LSWPSIPGCNIFTAMVCKFLVRGLADANLSLPLRTLAEIETFYKRPNKESKIKDNEKTQI